MTYTFERIDTATRVRREELLRLAPEFGTIATDRPQFVLFDDGKIADWPMMDSFEEATETCKLFNAPDDDQGARSEALWQARMAGDLSA